LQASHSNQGYHEITQEDSYTISTNHPPTATTATTTTSTTIVFGKHYYIYKAMRL